MHDIPPIPQTQAGFYTRLVVYLSLAFVTGMTIGFQRDAGFTQPEVVDAQTAATRVNPSISANSQRVSFDLVFSAPAKGFNPPREFTEAQPAQSGETVQISVRARNDESVDLPVQKVTIRVKGSTSIGGHGPLRAGQSAVWTEVIDTFTPGVYAVTASVGSRQLRSKNLVVVSPIMLTNPQKSYFMQQSQNFTFLSNVVQPFRISTADFNFNQQRNLTFETWFKPVDLKLNPRTFPGSLAQLASADMTFVGHTSPHYLNSAGSGCTTPIGTGLGWLQSHRRQSPTSPWQTAYNGFSLRLSTDQNRTLITGAGADRVRPDAWNHLVVTFSSGSPDTVRFYVNGSVVPSSTIGLAPGGCVENVASVGSNGTLVDTNPSPVHIGQGRIINSGGNFIGSLYKLRLYNTALQPSEIAEHYRGEYLTLPR